MGDAFAPVLKEVGERFRAPRAGLLAVLAFGLVFLGNPEDDAAA
jgi:hypothetical protein